ncbi:MAG: hypothetical protein IPO04_09020 [Cytophagaceae bacterium]|nr:hypothetical protein [Cytophagaceae bacterium]
MSLTRFGIFFFLIFCFSSQWSYGQSDSLFSKIDSLKKKQIETKDTTQGAKLRSFRKNSKDIVKKSFGLTPFSEKETPKIAFFRSVLFPGWGQITNKQYIKLPIIYGSAAVGAYFIKKNNNEFLRFKGYLLEMAADTINNPTEYTIKNENGTLSGPYSKSVITSAAKQYKRWRDGTIIGFSVGWLLFAIEANVAAHMKTFDISDDISMNISGSTIGQTGLGIKMKFNFK